MGSNLEELERMTSIVNDMLFLSHAHAGEHASQLTQVSLREETLKTAEYVEPSFAEKQLSLEVEGDITAHIDRRLFHRSLANLLENSARHSPSNSTVTVRLSEKGNQVCVDVSNHGDPIAPEHLHRLFERFYRVDTSRAGVIPIMGWACRLSVPSPLCTGEMSLPVARTVSIPLA